MKEKNFKKILNEKEQESSKEEKELEVKELLDKILKTNGEIDEDIKWDDYDLITTYMFKEPTALVLDKYVNDNKLTSEQRCMIYEYIGNILNDCTNVIMRDTVRSQDNMQGLMLLLLHIMISDLQDDKEMNEDGINALENMIDDIDKNPYDIDMYDYYTHLLIDTFVECCDEEENESDED